MKKAAIIIVNWNGLRFLKDCLSSVYKQTYKNFEVYFVDNGSVDDSVTYVKNNFPRVNVIKLDRNTGFAEGNNIGIKEAFKDKKVEYIVCLNNDTVVDKNWLKELITSAEKDKKIGMVSSLVILPDGSIHNIGLSLERSLELNMEGGISIGYGLKNLRKFSKDLDIFAPSGTAVLFKRNMLNKIYSINNEFFDEDFFAYVEDSDIGFIGRYLGYTCVFSSKAKLIHFHSMTLGRASPKKIFLIKRNILFLAIKYLSLKNLISFLACYFKLNLSYLKKNDSLRSIKEKTKISKIIPTILFSYLLVLIYLPKMLIKRNRIMRARVVKESDISRWFEKYSRETIEK